MNDENHLRSISPARLNIITIGLWLSLFISSVEVTIVSTALFKISDDLTGLNISQWIVVSYLLTYNAFLLIISKLSDIFGQRSMLVLANMFFLIFSIACGAAKTMKQLIIFRALQGIGGAGLFSLVFVVIMKLVTIEKVGLYSAILSSVFAVANLLGPVLGGVITDHSSWRWIFYMNGPICAVSLLIIVPAMPNLGTASSNKKLFGRIDILGAILSVAWPIPFVFAIQEGGSSYSWKSAIIIGTFVGGAVSMLIFVAWEMHVDRKGKQEPIFPIRLLADPVVSFILLSVLLQGFAFYPAILLLPQRFQATNGSSAARAGVQLLCMTAASPISSLIAGIVIPKRNPPAEYLILTSTILITIGIGLISSLPTSRKMPVEVYGFEVILGAGMGFLTPSALFLLKYSVHDDDIAAVTGATNMARTMGGSISVSICSALLHSSLDRDLPAFLTRTEVAALKYSLANLSQLPLSNVAAVMEVFGRAYNLQFRVLIAFSAANILVAALLVVAIKRRDSRQDGQVVQGSSNDSKATCEIPAVDESIKETEKVTQLN